MSSGRPKFILPISAICVIVTAILLTAAFVPTQVAAGFPKNVRGFVKDINGDPIVNANVTVILKDGVTVKDTQWYDSSQSDGYYSITFGVVEIGYTIEATATLGLDSGTNTTTVIDTSPIQNVDVTISIVIPEFGLFGSFSIAIMSLFMIAVMLITRRRKLD